MRPVRSSLCVRFTDGITNNVCRQEFLNILDFFLPEEAKTSPSKLQKAVKRQPGYTIEQIDSEAILLRAYNNGTEVLIDRDRQSFH